MLSITPVSIISFTSLIALIAIILHRKHILIVLLFFEAVILTFILILPIITSFKISYFSAIFLTFGACEARIGLALLVAITR